MKEKSVIIIEDEALIALDLELKFKQLGMHVEMITANGNDLIKYLKSCKSYPDLLLMDINLQGALDGIETAEIVQNKIGAIPVIFRSGYNIKELEKQICDHGIKNFYILNKMFNTSELKAEINCLVKDN